VVARLDAFVRTCPAAADLPRSKLYEILASGRVDLGRSPAGSATCDLLRLTPATATRNAPVGTAEWAKRWRLSFQTIVKIPAGFAPGVPASGSTRSARNTGPGRW
jgi:hypothetical protein